MLKKIVLVAALAAASFGSLTVAAQRMSRQSAASRIVTTTFPDPNCWINGTCAVN